MAKLGMQILRGTLSYSKLSPLEKLTADYIIKLEDLRSSFYNEVTKYL